MIFSPSMQNLKSYQSKGGGIRPADSGAVPQGKRRYGKPPSLSGSEAVFDQIVDDWVGSSLIQRRFSGVFILMPLKFALSGTVGDEIARLKGRGGFESLPTWVLQYRAARKGDPCRTRI